VCLARTAPGRVLDLVLSWIPAGKRF